MRTVGQRSGPAAPRSSWAWNRWRWGVGDPLGSATVTLLCTTETAFGYFRPLGRPRSATNGYPAVTVQRWDALIP